MFYFYYKTYLTNDKHHFFIAGLLFGLAVLTHLMAALWFFGLSIVFILLKDKKKLLYLLLSYLVAGLIVLPYLLWVLFNFDIILNHYFDLINDETNISRFLETVGINLLLAPLIVTVGIYVLFHSFLKQKEMKVLNRRRYFFYL